MLPTEITNSHLNNHICQHRGMKTTTVTPSFYYVFNISFYYYDTIPNFIGNLYRVLLLGNHLKYEFTGAPEHEVKVKHHGNAKSCSIPYLRTYKSTLESLEKNAKERGKGLKRAVHEVETEVGDLQNCNSVGALPRNERQAKYLKTKEARGHR